MKSKPVDFSQVKAVFIDLDNTLWDFSSNSEKALHALYLSNGLDRLLPFYVIFREIYETRNSHLWHEYHHGLVSREYLMVERFAHVLRQIGFEGNVEAEGLRLNNEYLDRLATYSALMPGARTMLEYLRGKGYQVNVLSNGFDGIQQRKLQSAGVEHLVDRIILSDHCGVTKPQPGLFEYAMEQCGVVACECVMIGDDPDTDIRGAHEVGWRTIYYNVKNHEPFEGTADVEVSHLDQVRDWL